MTDLVKILRDDASSLTHEAALGAEHAIRSTQRFAHKGLNALSHGSDQMREKSIQVKDATSTYIRHEPLKSMLMAAAVGATLMGLVALFSRHSGSDR